MHYEAGVVNDLCCRQHFAKLRKYILHFILCTKAIVLFEKTAQCPILLKPRRGVYRTVSAKMVVLPLATEYAMEHQDLLVHI